MSLRYFFPGFRSKALTFSYDDGQQYDRRLVELFNRYRLKATFHLVSGLFDRDPWVSSKEVRDLYAGHEISCHTLNHPLMNRIPQTEIMREIWSDRNNLEKLAGYPVQGMSYPCGECNEEIAGLCRSAGIIYSRTIISTGKFALPDDFLFWNPTCHHKEAEKYIDPFLKCYYDMSVFYVWGHSHEFQTEADWERMEKFCGEISGKAEIWYATNIEICRYVQAVRGLVISCDGTLAYNPSAETVCCMNGEKRIEIRPGAVTEL